MQVGDQEMEVRELPLPDELPPGYVSLRVEATGICGTDVSRTTAPSGASWATSTHNILGHEAGHIAAITPEATACWDLDVGARGDRGRAVGHVRSLRVLSRALEMTLRTERFIYGFESTTCSPGLWGAYAEYMVLHPDSRLFSIPEAMPIEDACPFNVLAGGSNWGAVVPETQAGDDVVIIGPGLRAMASVMAAKEGGGAEHRRRRPCAESVEDRDRRAVRCHALPQARHRRRRGGGSRILTGGLGAHRVIDYVPHVTETFDLACWLLPGPAAPSCRSGSRVTRSRSPSIGCASGSSRSRE